MDKWLVKEEQEQSGKLRKSYHFTVMMPFQLGEYNIYVISGYNHIQNLSRYLASDHDTIQF